MYIRCAEAPRLFCFSVASDRAFDCSINEPKHCIVALAYGDKMLKSTT
jgi:hypothetical protein